MIFASRGFSMKSCSDTRPDLLSTFYWKSVSVQTMWRKQKWCNLGLNVGRPYQDLAGRNVQVTVYSRAYLTHTCNIENIRVPNMYVCIFRNVCRHPMRILLTYGHCLTTCTGTC